MKKVLIIGLGELGTHLANYLNELGHEICIVDNDPTAIQLLESRFPNAYIGDCMQKQVLEKIGVKDFDVCYVCVGGNFQASLEITSNLKELKAKKIVAKAISDIQAKFLTMAGADETVYPEKEMAEKMAIKCDLKNLLNFQEIDKKYGIYEINVPKVWIGKSVLELNIRKICHVNVIAIRKGEKAYMPDGGYEFEEDTTVILVGRKQDIKNLTR